MAPERVAECPCLLAALSLAGSRGMRLLERPTESCAALFA